VDIVKVSLYLVKCSLLLADKFAHLVNYSMLIEYSTLDLSANFVDLVTSVSYLVTLSVLLADKFK